MARAEDKETALRTQEVRLARLAREVVRDFVPRALDKRIDLGYEGPEQDDPATRLIGQPLLVRELIRNLVDNALQYTPAGGVVTVRVMPDPFGQVIVLQVEDSGPGIPEAERELVFQAFYRSLGTEVDGSGLGLRDRDRHPPALVCRDIRPGAGRAVHAALSPVPGRLTQEQRPSMSRLVSAGRASQRRPLPPSSAQLCINVRLRAIDISSPRPRPRVTIAVPP
jgi:hypothetical protein